MRFVHIDETGISNKPEVEPYTVVAGVISHADHDWKPLQKRLHEMADKYAPEGKRDGFYFQASQLYSGGGFFPRADYSDEYRKKILDELLALPAEFRLPIAYGAMDRAAIIRRESRLTPNQASVVTHTVSYSLLVVQIEKFMREKLPKEVATLIAEDREEARVFLKDAYRDLKEPDKRGWLSTERQRKFLPLTMIAETPLFAEKTDSSILQIADACAFAIKRFLCRKTDPVRFSDHARFYDPIYDQLLTADDQIHVSQSS